MGKLIIVVVCSVVLAAVMLQLRQQRLDLGYESSRLHNQIESRQAKLWNQQLQIAVCTAPNAIAESVQSRNLKLVAPASLSPLPAQTAAWLEPQTPSDAQ